MPCPDKEASVEGSEAMKHTIDILIEYIRLSGYLHDAYEGRTIVESSFDEWLLTIVKDDALLLCRLVDLAREKHGDGLFESSVS